jgi:hypothetical protein
MPGSKAKLGAGADVGIYRLLCQLSSDDVI